MGTSRIPSNGGVEGSRSQFPAQPVGLEKNDIRGRERERERERELGQFRPDSDKPNCFLRFLLHSNLLLILFHFFIFMLIIPISSFDGVFEFNFIFEKV